MVLTVFLLLQSSSGDVFFAGRQKRCLFQSVNQRCINSRKISSKFNPGFHVPRHHRLRHLPIFRGKKRALFLLPRRLASTLTCALKSFQGSNTYAVSIQDSTCTKSIRRTRRKLVERFWLPVISRETTQRLVSIFRFFLLGYIGLELVLIIRESFREILDEFEDSIDDGKKDRGASRKAFSKNSVEKLLAWLEKSEDKRTAPLSNVVPDWKISLVQEMNEIPIKREEFREILLDLTNAEAKLLRMCLFPSNRKVNLSSDIGGFFRIRNEIISHIGSAFKKYETSSDAPDPYKELLSKDNRHQHMVLWGPPGIGKTLIIRGIVKSLQLPTLVISPNLIQSYQKLEILFSLVSKLEACVLVLDDLEVLFPSRQFGNNDVAAETRTAILQWWDTMVASEELIFMIAATNQPWTVDTAAWRRFSNRIYMGLPNEEDRYHILKIISKDLPPIEESVLKYISHITEGYLPLELNEALVRSCQEGPMARQDTTLKCEDVNAALSTHSVRTGLPTMYCKILQSYVAELSSGSSALQSQTQQTASTSDAHDYFSPHVIQSSQFGDNGYCWETVLGDFYQLQIPVDSKVLDAIRTILLYTTSFYYNSNEDWDLSDDDKYEDDDDDDQY